MHVPYSPPTALKLKSLPSLNGSHIPPWPAHTAYTPHQLFPEFARYTPYFFPDLYVRPDRMYLHQSTLFPFLLLKTPGYVLSTFHSQPCASPMSSPHFPPGHTTRAGLAKTSAPLMEFISRLPIGRVEAKHMLQVKAVHKNLMGTASTLHLKARHPKTGPTNSHGAGNGDETAVSPRSHLISAPKATSACRSFSHKTL